MLPAHQALLRDLIFQPAYSSPSVRKIYVACWFFSQARRGGSPVGGSPAGTGFSGSRTGAAGDGVVSGGSGIGSGSAGSGSIGSCGATGGRAGSPGCGKGSPGCGSSVFELRFIKLNHALLLIIDADILKNEKLKMQSRSLTNQLKFDAIYIFNISDFRCLTLRRKRFVIFFDRTVTKQVRAAFR